MERNTFNGFIDEFPTTKKKYSFHFDGEKVNLNPLTPNDRMIFGGRHLPVDFCPARYTSGGTVAFYNCGVEEVGIFSGSGEIRLHPTYYFYSRAVNVQADSFDRIQFTGELVNLVFPPIQKVEYDSDNPSDNPLWFTKEYDGSKTIKTKPFAQVDKSFVVSIDGVICTCRFGVFSPGSITEKDSNLGELKSYFSIEFHSSQSLEKLKTVYLIVRKFFQFLLNRQEIWFNEIVISNRNKNGKYENNGYFVDLKVQPDTPPKSCSQFSCFEPHVDKLFELISREDINFNYITKNSKEAKYVTQEQYVTCCGAFEYNYNQFYTSDESNDAFKYETIEKIKNFLGEIDTLKKEERKYYAHIVDVLEKDINSVEACFNRCRKKYACAVDEYILRISQNRNVNKSTNFGSHFSSFRNEKAHGELTPFTHEAVCAYLIGIVLIECMLLDHCGYTKSEIKTIVEQRYIR